MNCQGQDGLEIQSQYILFEPSDGLLAHVLWLRTTTICTGASLDKSGIVAVIEQAYNVDWLETYEVESYYCY